MSYQFSKEDDEILHQILRMAEMKKTEPDLFSEYYSEIELYYGANVLKDYITKIKELQETFGINDSINRLQNIGTVLDYLTVEKSINPLAVLESNASLMLDLLCSAYNDLIPEYKEEKE